MGDQRILARSQTASPCAVADSQSPGPEMSRGACLVQLLLAFCDIADRDDIHQAAQRLETVQQWIRADAQRAALDPIFADLLPI